MRIKMQGHSRQDCSDTIFWQTFVFVGLILLTGCGKSTFESTVSGTVTLDDVPIGPGVIQFIPVERSHNPATGTIQVGGAYRLKTNNDIGLRPGEYDVTVAVYDQPELAPGERAAPGSAPLRTPTKYFSLQTTDLRFAVIPGKNKIDIPLVTK